MISPRAVPDPRDRIALADWRRAIAVLYGEVRQASASNRRQACGRFRSSKDRLFRLHSQSPLPAAERDKFRGLPYYPYDPAWQITAPIDFDVPHETTTTRLGADGEFRFTRIGRAVFAVGPRQAALSIYWIEGYGGGVFLPFRDATSGDVTYGGGRYLFDTIKGADLGVAVGAIVLDFNYAYNPSCAYAADWVCPLAPSENTLPLPVEAGERAIETHRPAAPRPCF